MRPDPTSWRIVLVYSALVPLAAILTVLVSWRCSVFYLEALDSTARVVLSEREIEASWNEHSRLTPRSERFGFQYARPGQRTLQIESGDELDYANLLTYRWNGCVVDDFGWPMVALRRRGHLTGTTTGTTRDLDWTWSFRLGTREYRLPLRPLWLGAIVDVAVFFAVLVGLRHLLARYRRRARTDRGRCPRCVYDLRGVLDDEGVRCPECGVVSPGRWFRRPRQILRPWMTPLLLAPLALAAVWFFAGAHWSWTRFQLRYVDPFVGRSTIVSGLVLFAWIWILAERSYRDRPRWQRLPLSTLVALALSAVVQPSVFALAHRLLHGPP